MSLSTLFGICLGHFDNEMTPARFEAVWPVEHNVESISDAGFYWIKPLRLMAEQIMFSQPKA